MENTFGFLKLIQSADLSFWDVKRLSFSFSSLSTNYPVMRLEHILSPIKNKIKKSEYNGKVPIVAKISFNDGKIHLRDDFKTGMDLYYLSLNDLLVSNINFHQGAIAINKIGDVACSTHYQPYRVNFLKVISEYLILVLRSKYFLEYISQQKVNGIKTEANYNFIKDLEIPLPSIEKQKELVAHYNSLLTLAKDKEQQANELEKSIDDYLMAELGIEDNCVTTSQNLFQVVQYRNVNDWGKITNIGNLKSHFNIVPFSQIITEGPFYGANVKGCNVNNGCRYIRITDIRDDGTLNENIVYPEKIDTRYLLKENDFLIARSGATVGKTFLYKACYGRCIFAGYLVRYRISSNIDPVYLLYYTQSSIYKKWVKQTQRVAAQPNINGQEYLKFLVVLPPLNIQNKIVQEITSRKKQIQYFHKESEKLRLQALSDFEMEVFN